MTCTHRTENPEGIVWLVDVSLDHFDNCLDQKARLMTWRMTRDLAEQASRCLLNDHAGSVALLTELLQRPHRRAVRAAYRVRARRRTRSHR
jgi:hypothetical protein